MKTEQSTAKLRFNFKSVLPLFRCCSKKYYIHRLYFCVVVRFKILYACGYGCKINEKKKTKYCVVKSILSNHLKYLRYWYLSAVVCVCVCGCSVYVCFLKRCIEIMIIHHSAHAQSTYSAMLCMNWMKADFANWNIHTHRENLNGFFCVCVCIFFENFLWLPRLCSALNLQMCLLMCVCIALTTIYYSRLMCISCACYWIACITYYVLPFRIECVQIYI